MGLSSKNMSEYIKVVVKSKIVGHHELQGGDGRQRATAGQKKWLYAKNSEIYKKKFTYIPGPSLGISIDRCQFPFWTQGHGQ